MVIRTLGRKKAKNKQNKSQLLGRLAVTQGKLIIPILWLSSKEHLHNGGGVRVGVYTCGAQRTAGAGSPTLSVLQGSKPGFCALGPLPTGLSYPLPLSQTTILTTDTSPLGRQECEITSAALVGRRPGKATMLSHCGRYVREGNPKKYKCYLN